ncbi:MAG: hypothetical protein OXQ31_05255 [Spirochaetaceae bacterium]|nr:hypothetical protein [Spirochaetaceae bacterium]
MASPEDKMKLARRHLERVQVAWEDPTDWADLSFYGLYALEAAVDAALLFHKKEIQPAHWYRVEAAKQLSSEHGLDDVSELIGDLNDVRKREAYGDAIATELDAVEVATTIEKYIDSVAAVVDEQ